MGKLYFHYSTMNAGKSTGLLQAAHNYIERGLLVYLLTAKIDVRAGKGQIASRIGLSKEADCFDADSDLYVMLGEQMDREKTACVFVDEAQFLSKTQVWQLAQFVDDYNVPVMCYGLRTDFQGELFPGSAALLAVADEMREVRTICWCGKKATMVVRRGPDGKAQRAGEQVQIGGNDVYVSLCRRHWREEMGDLPAALPKSRQAVKEVDVTDDADVAAKLRGGYRPPLVVTSTNEEAPPDSPATLLTCGPCKPKDGIENNYFEGESPK
jgi:thymidine kinase